MVKCGVFFEVRTGFLSAIYISFGYKGLSTNCQRDYYDISLISMNIDVLIWVKHVQNGNQQIIERDYIRYVKVSVYQGQLKRR
jgi:hypothetical protein